MSRSKKDSKGKVLNEDLLVEVKPLEPWPDPPPKKGPDPQRSQKPSGGASISKQNPRKPPKKDRGR